MLDLRDFKTEYRTNPIGMDERNPRFSWKLESDKKDMLQKAYQVIVETEKGVVWDSGKVESDQSLHIKYEGKALEPMTAYSVKVKVWDCFEEEASAECGFETGLLHYSGFIGRWIGSPIKDTEACPVFFKSFTINKKVKAARVYASAKGVYELNLNDERVSDYYFAPGWTNYRKRIQYQTYDITELLQDNNVIKMTVGNGWYKGCLGVVNQPNHYGTEVAAIAQIRIVYEDGSDETIGTEESWQCTTGDIRYSEIYHGETIDRTIGEQEVFSVEVLDDSIEVLVGQENEPVRITKRFTPRQLIITPKGETVIDFGQNMSGIVEIKTDCEPGTRITVKHAEVLDKHGNFYTENLRLAKATDTYVCKGGKETFLPHFTFHGFRYISVEGLGKEPDLSCFTACALHTDMDVTGGFECSNKYINQLQSNIQWGQRGNFLDLPTDCPQRDERLAWTGDAQVFSGTAAYNMNVALFFRKWLRDLWSEQTMEYGVPEIVPNIHGNKNARAAWGDAATIVPWVMYQAYGDIKFLEEQYDSMKSWVEYIRSRTGKNGLWQRDFQFGDWIALDNEELIDRVGFTDVYFIASAYYAYSTEILYKTAELLGFENDYKTYKALHEKTVDAFNEEYITATGRLASETQTAYILALHFNLANEKYRERILQSLKENLERHKDHLVTGFVGTPYICHTLSENGLHKIAQKLLLNDDYPSWLYAVKRGATTIWERWNSLLPNGDFDASGMNSFNHYAYGSIGEWMYQKIAGIQIVEPGYKKFKISPMLTEGMTYVKGTLDTLYGTIISSWKCKDGKIEVDITVPANTRAIICLPEKQEEFEVGSGSYHYEYETTTNLEFDKYSLDSTLGQLLDNPLGIELLNQYSPGMTESPLIKFAYEKSIDELSKVMPPEGIELFKVVINALNQAEKA